MAKKIRLIPPGEMLFKDFLEPLGLSQNRLARELFVSPTKVNDIVNGKRRISPEMSLRFSRYFNTTPQFWLNMQQDYDLELVKEN